MKRLTCLALCLVLALTALALADDNSVPRLFNAQFITGGNGLRGKAVITASGSADWLDVLMPFTGMDIQIRAIGQKQGAQSDLVTDDDSWQLRLYTENRAEEAVANTYLYSGEGGVYFSSELLPGTVLMLPANGAHLLYDAARGSWENLFFGFDPAGMTGWSESGRPMIYETIAELLDISGESWDASWAPVMAKYETDLDMWLNGYVNASSENSVSGSLVMKSTYTIPAADMKAKAKQVIGSMLFDSELQELLAQTVSSEIRSTYLNPSLVYFYEACIDALDLQGDAVLSRSMSARGETTAVTVSLPVPALPGEIAEGLNGLLQAAFSLPYEDALSGLHRIILRQEGDTGYVELQTQRRMLRIAVDEALTDAESTELTGSVQIIPAPGMNELPLYADFAARASHAVFQDEKYLSHDKSSFALSLTPDAAMAENTSMLSFAPVGFDLTVDYLADLSVPNSSIQINLLADVQLPGADLSLDAKLRTRSAWELAKLPTAGALDVTRLSAEQLESLRSTFAQGAVQTVLDLFATPTPEPAATEVPPLE